jgi:hypothetical protein
LTILLWLKRVRLGWRSKWKPRAVIRRWLLGAVSVKSCGKQSACSGFRDAWELENVTCFSQPRLLRHSAMDGAVYEQTFIAQFWRLREWDQVPAWMGSGEGPLLAADCRLFVVPSHGRKRAKLLPGVSSKGTSPIHGGSTFLI